MQVLVKEALQLSARLRLSNSIPNHEVRHIGKTGSARAASSCVSLQYGHIRPLAKAQLCRRSGCCSISWHAAWTVVEGFGHADIAQYLCASGCL